MCNKQLLAAQARTAKQPLPFSSHFCAASLQLPQPKRAIKKSSPTGASEVPQSGRLSDSR
jgi:hypothetical protein